MTIAAAWSASRTASSELLGARFDQSRQRRETGRRAGTPPDARPRVMRQPRNAASNATGRASGPPPNNSRCGGGAMVADEQFESGARQAQRFGYAGHERGAAQQARVSRFRRRMQCDVRWPARIAAAMPASGCHASSSAERESAECPWPLRSRRPDRTMIRGAAQVVTHDARDAAGGHFTRVLAQITFETAARQQAGVFTVGRDQHLRTGFRIGGATRA